MGKKKKHRFKNLIEGRKYSGEVLHVGAHYGQELKLYNSIGFSKAWWVEANESLIPKLRANISRFRGKMVSEVISAVVSDSVSKAEFKIANKSASSSLLEFGTHRDFHPDIHFVKTVEVVTTTIDELNQNYDFSKVELIAIDIQGAELLALKGAVETLKTAKEVFLEVTEKEMYVGCGLLDQVGAFLDEYGFQLKDKSIIPDRRWGDALFVKGHQ
jgi:FkbM family methyltransferase